MNTQELIREEFKELKEKAYIKGTYIFPLAFNSLQEIKNESSTSSWA